MESMNFKSCKADPDVWFRPGTKEDGDKYMNYVLLYTDNILCIMKDQEKFLVKGFGECFKLKDVSIGPSTQYLGDKVFQVTLDNGAVCWSISSS